jgi:penicillin-binding protein 1A
MDQTSAFSTFPNDGLRAIPHYILKVTDYDGRILEQNFPIVQDVIRQDTARTMTWMLREAVLHGTGRAATRLKNPVAGKTGTTNNFTDAWFVGFSTSITCGVWVGFDEKRTLGDKETGAKAALPIWIDFMGTALARQGSSRDFLPPSKPLNRAFAIQTTEFLPIPGKSSRQNANSEPNALITRPASKTSADSPDYDEQER